MIMVHAVVTVLAIASADTGKHVSFTGDAGLVNTSGNTDVTTLNLGDKLGIRLGRWSMGQAFSYTYARSDDTVSASLWHASLRGDRAVSSRVGIYLLTEFDRNQFAGVDSRIAPSAGLTGTLVQVASDTLRLEAGAGYTWQHAVAPDSARDYVSGRLAVAYWHRLGRKASFTQALEFLPDVQDSKDVRVNSETAVTAPITSGIAMKASYVVHYDGVPEPGFKHTDRILTTGVQVTF